MYLASPLDLRTPALLLMPGTCIAQRAATLAIALAAKLLGQVLRRNLREELLLVRGANDVDLLDRDLVEPWLDDSPHGCERPRRVDDVELAHGLWVSVLADARCLHHVVLHPVEGGDTDTLEIEDGA